MAVVRVLRGLDVIEKVIVDDGLAGGCDRLDPECGALGIAAGAGAAPGALKLREQRSALWLGNALEESCLVQQWMANAGVAPVDQGELLAGHAHVARVEVAVDQAIGHATLGQARPARVEPLDAARQAARVCSL